MVHSKEYDEAILEHQWTYKSSSESRNPTSLNTRNIRNQEIPSFSPATFMEYLVRFVVVDDQVSLDDLALFQTLTGLQSIRVVECPEFRQLCMVLCGTLVDADIPRRDKMREAIINQWRGSFEQLKSELSVRMKFCRFALLTSLRS
jgi:hypothetical protein